MIERIRAAEPDDITFLANIMYQSTVAGVGQGLFDDALAGTGASPLLFNEAMLRTATSKWGQLKDFLILEDDQGPIGAAAAYAPDPEDLRPITPNGLSKLAEQLEWSTEVTNHFYQKFVRLFGLFGSSPQLQQPARYVIEYAAVIEERRGLGLIRHLLAAHAARAKDNGCDTLGISAMIGNDRASRAYLRFGFKELYRLTREDYSGRFPGMIRYVKPL
ncbi:hypothetical protein GCM10007036_31320 [Alsobacter metallidurans]|uniref:N-acetyltransferase domain-containing protein n=1 Tax=Alsobacter metallidurans TaxID=340221 RepID=A0A917I918_9HYPH|nr:GNAT family N-acetyltransferase [Alsobacter metallidurans]GGH24726.1 hypothetical protein GCM10007036_31320 [Alsobacter metallidurans]